MNNLPFLMMDAATAQRGGTIAIVGLVIVFIALILISLFIASLPRLLGLLQKVFPEVEGHHHPGSGHGAVDLEDETESIFAAIGYAMHLQRQGNATKK